MPDYTPTEIATMDQNNATLNRDIDKLIKTYEHLSSVYDENEALVRLAAWVGEELWTEPRQLLLMTAVMVRRLADQAGGRQ